MRDTDQQTRCARAAEPFMATGCSCSLSGLGRVIPVIPAQAGIQKTQRQVLATTGFPPARE